ncbi:16S rRNA (guanine(527)-N(7))-methyltransferase RsmG [Marinibacterium sp. SX1]|uniref:16S rRNA (guanine(527)-N(7))-methyltransferase RsmG n=1 Tax=Marinibacterium sp. SX1 TaxID=3388424 RepID=UPI003D17A8A9
MNDIIRPEMAALDVSRETFERLEAFADLILKWNPRINLISRASIPDLWTRHIKDSIQVYKAGHPAKHWVDLGSGGGFPGVIAAICAAGASIETKFTLIESDQRKSVFLRTAARTCGLDNFTVLSKRIEAVDPQNADVVSARALADLTTLLGYAARHAAPDSRMLFPKGKTWGKELEEARRTWNFEAETITSETEPDAVLLILKGVSRD